MATQNSINEDFSIESPHFITTLTTTAYNLTGSGELIVVPFNSIISENVAGFNTGTYKYIVQTTGYYLISYSIYLSGVTGSHGHATCAIRAGSNNYLTHYRREGGYHCSDTTDSFCSSKIVYVSAGDEIYMLLRITLGAKSVDIVTDSASNPLSWFSGRIIT